MKIEVKDLSVDMDLKNTGITLDVRDNGGKFLGDLRIGKATLEWCAGKTRAGNGVKRGWDDLINWFENKS